jgi:hypothetical protein
VFLSSATHKPCILHKQNPQDFIAITLDTGTKAHTKLTQQQLQMHPTKHNRETNQQQCSEQRRRCRLRPHFVKPADLLSLIFPVHHDKTAGRQQIRPKAGTTPDVYQHWLPTSWPCTTGLHDRPQCKQGHATHVWGTMCQLELIRLFRTRQPALAASVRDNYIDHQSHHPKSQHALAHTHKQSHPHQPKRRA